MAYQAAYQATYQATYQADYPAGQLAFACQAACQAAIFFFFKAASYTLFSLSDKVLALFCQGKKCKNKIDCLARRQILSVY